MNMCVTNCTVTKSPIVVRLTWYARESCVAIGPRIAMFQPTLKPTPIPPTRSTAAEPTRRGRGLHALEHDDGDPAVRPLLVLVVVRPDLVHRPPEPVAFFAFGVARAGSKLLALDLHADLGMLAKVAIPARMLRRPTLRCHDHRVLAL